MSRNQQKIPGLPKYSGIFLFPRYIFLLKM